MDASFQSRAEQLASEFAGQATTVDELNGLMRLMMKSGLERMLNTEMDVHLGRRSALATDEPPVSRLHLQPIRRIVATDIRRKRSKAIWVKWRSQRYVPAANYRKTPAARARFR